MNNEELSSYLNWPGDRPSSVEGAEPGGDEVQSDAGNGEAPVNNELVNEPPNEPGVEKEPPVAPATEEPAAASYAEPSVEPPVEPREDSPIRGTDSPVRKTASAKKTPVKRAGPSTKKVNSPEKETPVVEPSRRSTRSQKADSSLKEPAVAEPVRRLKRAKRIAAGTLAVIEEIEPLKTQFVISSDSKGEDRASDEEDSVSNEETTTGNSASDEDTTEEDSNY